MRHARLYNFTLLLTVHLIVHGYLVLQSQTTLPTAEGIYRRNSLSASLGMAMLTIREYAYSASLGSAWQIVFHNVLNAITKW